jgi:DNA-binding CsgD family transcriptional regulator
VVLVATPTLIVPLLLWHDERPRSLSKQERVVVGLAACGFDNDKIAGLVGVELSTVRAQMSSAMRKMNCKNRTQLVMVALLAGLVDVEEVVARWRLHTPEVVEVVDQDSDRVGGGGA